MADLAKKQSHIRRFLAGDMGAAAYLSQPSGKACDCGAGMQVWQELNGCCEQCRVARVGENLRGASLEDSEIGIPSRYAHCTAKSYRGWPPDMVRSWLSELGDWLVILGRPGTGKTHLATAAARELYRLGRVVLWRSARSISELPLDGLLSSREAQCEVLVVDDYGAELAHRPLDMLLGKRYDARKLTILTTNLDDAEIERRDARIASRLLGEVVVKLGGHDQRRLPGGA